LWKGKLKYFLRPEKMVHNIVDSFSNLENGMYQMAFLDKIDVYGGKNRLIRYL